jgi:hypothetical protein
MEFLELNYLNFRLYFLTVFTTQEKIVSLYNYILEVASSKLLNKIKDEKI